MLLVELGLLAMADVDRRANGRWSSAFFVAWPLLAADDWASAVGDGIAGELTLLLDGWAFEDGVEVADLEATDTD